MITTDALLPGIGPREPSRPCPFPSRVWASKGRSVAGSTPAAVEADQVAVCETAARWSICMAASTGRPARKAAPVPSAPATGSAARPPRTPQRGWLRPTHRSTPGRESLLNVGHPLREGRAEGQVHHPYGGHESARQAVPPEPREPSAISVLMVEGGYSPPSLRAGRGNVRAAPRSARPRRRWRPVGRAARRRRHRACRRAGAPPCCSRKFARRGGGRSPSANSPSRPRRAGRSLRPCRRGSRPSPRERLASSKGRARPNNPRVADRNASTAATRRRLSRRSTRAPLSRAKSSHGRRRVKASPGQLERVAG